MKRDSLLVTGLGQCGGILADMLKQVNKRYTTLYVNSSLGDIKGLKFADIESNVFIYGGADGSGRDRSRANKFIINDRVRLASMIRKFGQFKYMLIFTSFSGGTGSGTVIEFIKTVKALFPNMIINLVGVLPSLKENNLELKNALDCLDELNEVAKLINDIKFIDNNKRINYEDINKEAIASIDECYSMLGHHIIGSVDEDNLTNVTTCKGYGVALKLDTSYDNLEACIRHSVKDSVFALPSNLECVYGAINVPEKYDVKETKEFIKTNETLYMTYGKRNALCLGGCAFPEDAIDELDSTYKERELRKDSSTGRGFMFKSRFGQANKKESAVDTVLENDTKVKYVDDDDIDSIFNLNNFKF